MRLRRVLFFAEAVTLAHVARPIVLASSLEGLNFETIIACDDRYGRFLADQSFRSMPLHSISSQRFLGSLRRGTPIYDLETLRRYVAEDIDLISRLQPDLIVGDFRLSLCVSARLVGIPYATVTNAYWSPYCREKSFPLPELPFTRCLPIPTAQLLFDAASRYAFGWHCAPLNRLRMEYGLSTIGADLRKAYTDADYTLYADAPTMFPTERLPSKHRFLGPILWSPPVPAPDWWHCLPPDKPIVYVTLGSSGSPRLLRAAVEALADQPVIVLAATAGTATLRAGQANLRAADYLPGVEASARSGLVDLQRWQSDQPAGLGAWGSGLGDCEQHGSIHEYGGRSALWCRGDVACRSCWRKRDPERCDRDTDGPETQTWRAGCGDVVQGVRQQGGVP